MKLFLIRNHPRLFAPIRPLAQRHKFTFKPPLGHFSSQQPLLLSEPAREQIPLTSEDIAEACLTIQNVTKASDRAKQENFNLFFSLYMNMTVTVLLNVALFYQIIHFMQSNDQSNTTLLKKEQEESLCCHL